MIIVIVGPTGVGKTKLSIALAKFYNGEIINADSTQIYKNLDIATAKITESEKENIPHHLLDIKELSDDYTVYDFQKDARLCIDDILKRNKTPIIVGGTGLYIKALLYDYSFKDQIKQNDYSKYTKEQLYQKLIKINPNTNIHINNRKRVERAIDYYNQTGTVIENNKTDTMIYDAIILGLTTSREQLYECINKRVDQMIDKGLLEEAKNIWEQNIRTKSVLTPIGYKELFPYFDKQKPLSDCLEEIKKNSRKYAKRQYTWFNNQMNVNWFSVDFVNFDNTVQNIKKHIEKNN